MLQMEQNPWLGFGAIAIAVLCSGFAGKTFLYAVCFKRTGQDLSSWGKLKHFTSLILTILIDLQDCLRVKQGLHPLLHTVSFYFLWSLHWICDITIFKLQNIVMLRTHGFEFKAGLSRRDGPVRGRALLLI